MEHTYGNCQCGDWHSAREIMEHFTEVETVTFHGPTCEDEECSGVCVDCKEKVGVA